VGRRREQAKFLNSANGRSDVGPTASDRKGESAGRVRQGAYDAPPKNYSFFPLGIDTTRAYEGHFVVGLRPRRCTRRKQR